MSGNNYKRCNATSQSQVLMFLSCATKPIQCVHSVSVKNLCSVRYTIITTREVIREAIHVAATATEKSQVLWLKFQKKNLIMIIRIW